MTSPITAGADELTGPFNTAFAQITQCFQQAIDAYNKIVETVNHWSWSFGIAVSWWIKHSLDNVRSGLDTVREKIAYALDHQVPVLSLINTSFSWISAAKTPISELSFQTTEPRDENMAKWTGDAASSYNAKATKQKAAVDESVTKSEFISQWLFKIAKSNVDFVVALAKIVNDIAGKLAQAAADATTVIDIPWAIDKLADSIGTMVKGLLDTIAQVGQRFIEALGNVRDIAGQVGDHSKLPGGNWPEAVRG
jgi:methyl-accepting chemotaxis protein